MKNEVFQTLGVKPNEVFTITGQSTSAEYRITDNLNIERREDSKNWEPSYLELSWFLSGKYGNGTPLKIIKKCKKMTLKEIEEILGYKIELISG